jgi:SAM-dependent methyltransferase
VEPAEFDRIAAAEDSHWWFQATRALVRDQMEPWLRPGLRSLDVGCGPGGNSAWLSEYGEHTGVDRSTEALELLRRRHPAMRAVEGDATELPFADASFDALLAITVLYMVERDDRALGEAFRVLRPGGGAVFFEPALEILRRDHDRVVGSVRRYRLPQLAARVRDAGFAVERATYAHAVLLPAALALAAVDRVRPAGPPRSDTDRDGGRALFAPLARLERRILARRDLPLGVSALVVARRPA